MQYRTHTCNDLRKEHVGTQVTLSGWVHRKRDHGGLIFIDLRDRYGITQIVFDPQASKNAWNIADQVKPEYVITIEGKVRARIAGAENKDYASGEIEIEGDNIVVLNTSETPPFEIDIEKNVNEEVRLNYRYLDLRRERMQKNVEMRYKITKFVRDYFDKNDFYEIETPILLKGTPEGAREFLVPSRHYPGKFFVLPQSPQQLKQLLMVSGFDKYFQIARCFRDEDQRGDRQPEFTQIDVEMSFVNSQDIMDMMESMILEMVQTLYSEKNIQSTPMPRLTWQEAMESYGSDRPDLRFDMKIVDVCEEVAACDFQVFKGALESGGSVKALRVPNAAHFSRKDIEELTEVAKLHGAKGLAYITWSKEEGLKSPILKFLSDDVIEKIKAKTQLQEGDIVFFGADSFQTACESLGGVRLEVAKKLDLIDKNVLAFCWVYNFPLYEKTKDGGLTSSHHPFTHPLHSHLHLLDTEPEKVIGEQYDMVLNGTELGGGTIRIHDPELQRKIFSILGVSDEDAERRFGHMLNAFKYGAPPHGGIAFGLDRMVMILQDEPNIREVIPFPKDQKAKDLMTGAPDIVPDAQIEEAGISILEENKQFEGKDEPTSKDLPSQELQSFLEENKIEYNVLYHPPLMTAEDAAREHGVPLGECIKKYVLRTENGFCLAILPGDTHLNFAKLQNILSVDKLLLADVQEVRKQTGFERSAMHPFGNLYKLPTYIDEKLKNVDIMYFSAGKNTVSAGIKTKDYIEHVAGNVCSFSGD